MTSATYDTMTLEERRARYQDRRALFGTGKPCAECGMDGTNVVHDPLEYRADDPYHQEFPDVPHHEFIADAVVLVSRAALMRLVGTWELEADIGSTIQGKAAYRTCATLLRQVVHDAVEAPA